MQKVRLRPAIDGYSEGELTGMESGGKYAVKLPSGKIVWLFPDEFVRI